MHETVHVLFHDLLTEEQTDDKAFEWLNRNMRARSDELRAYYRNWR
jgi:hypothetical protein